VLAWRGIDGDTSRPPAVGFVVDTAPKSGLEALEANVPQLKHEPLDPKRSSKNSYSQEQAHGTTPTSKQVPRLQLGEKRLEVWSRVAVLGEHVESA
jgi:hypothetical protein